MRRTDGCLASRAEELLPALAIDDHQLDLLKRPGLSSAATVAVRRACFAVIAIANGQGCYVTDADVSDLERVAARVASALTSL